MRILAVGNMYPPHHLGGYELIWRAAVEDLRASGHEVRVLTTDHREPEPDPSIPEDPAAHRELRWYWREHEFPRMSPAARLALERYNVAVLDHHLASQQTEVVGWWAMGGMSMSLIESVRRRGLPAVGFVHDEWMIYGPLVDAWHRLVNRRGMPRRLMEVLTRVPARVDFGAAAEWAFVSETTRRHAMEAGIELRRTTVAPSGVDRSLLRPAAMPTWRWRLLYVGRLDARKGVEIAIRALAHLPQASLRVLGGGDARYRAHLESLVADNGLEDRVEFGVVARHELAAAYAEADTVLFPTLWEEPWGLVPLEAMATGTPVVASGSGGSREYLRDGENCLLYAPRDDPVALARQVRRLAADETLRHALREAGFATARDNDRERFFATVAALHERAAAGEGSSPAP